MNQEQQNQNYVNKMIKYIQEETEKKVKKIDDDFEKESKLEEKNFVEPEKEKIQARFDKELENYKTEMKISQSQRKNKLRLEKLKTKIECVDDIFKEAKTELIKKIKNDSNEYRKILKDLIVQGLIRLLDNKINIICKKEDYELVKGLINEAKEEFLEKIKKEAKKSIQIHELSITINSKRFLPEDT